MIDQAKRTEKYKKIEYAPINVVAKESREKGQLDVSNI